jgi:exosortase A-associated hydrolase 1
MRRQVAFSCEGSALFGAVDLPEGPARAGLLIVSGGNETRAGAWNGQALIAARLAARGVAVFRFDRRGVGESEGSNAGFRGSQADIAAAIAAFRAEVPGLERVIGWGNCDAATALMLGGGFGLDGLVLSNPWTFDEADETGDDGDGGKSAAPAPPPAALRAHYLRRLADPRAVWRLLTGGVALGGLLGSLRAMARKAEQTGLAADMARGLARFGGPVKILLAGRDMTAQAFAGQWDKGDRRIATCPGASHSFVEPDAQEWLETSIMDMMTSQIT